MEDNIHLFDNYINCTLTPEETSEFENRLKSDKAFRQEFRIYLFTLQGIIMEAENDNVEFAYAMKNLSPGDFNKAIFRNSENEEYIIPAASFREPVDYEKEYDVCGDNDNPEDNDILFSSIDEVIGVNDEMPTPSFEMAPQDLIKVIEEVATDEEVKNEQKKSPFFRRKERFYWLGSIAALLIVGIFTVISVARSGEDKVDDVIAYYNQWAVNSARGGADELPDLSALKGEELTSAISSLRDTYENPKRSMQDR
ncbi:MAG: hypothetical protein K2H15_04375, partial [Muribaculaceae bacterium]|nr:hypothetical protein [Muribaculaceae bacterium]